MMEATSVTYGNERKGGKRVITVLAGATVTIIPIIIIYLFLQRWFVEGISNVGIRG